MSDNDYQLREPFRLSQDAGHVPQFVFVKTVAGPSPTAYPAEVDNPNTYYCRILTNATFTRTPGRRTLTYTTTSLYDYCFNLIDGHYVEENSVLCCLKMYNRLWTWDKIPQAEMVVLCHGKCATSEGTGTVSRLSPTDGSTMWTVDLGTDPATSRPRVGYRCALDSRGNVYVVWQVSSDSSGVAEPTSSVDASPSGGVKKYDSDGNELASITFPARHASFSNSGLGASLCRIVVSDDDATIYATTDYNTDGKWLYALNSSLSAQWSVGPAGTGAGATGRGSGLAIDASGNLFVRNSGGSSAVVYKLNSAGTLLDSRSNSPHPDALACVTSGALVAGGRSTSPGNALIDGWNAAFTALSWNKGINDFNMTSQGAGSWQAGQGTSLHSAVTDGSTIVLGAVTPARWNVTAGGHRFASLWYVDSAGSALDARGWGDWTTSGVSSNTYDLAWDQTSGQIYVCGIASVSSAAKAVHQLTGSWYSHLVLSGLAPTGWGIAARTVQT